MPTNFDQESLYRHCFNLVPNIGQRRLSKILQYFESARQAWVAKDSEWEKIDLEKTIVENIFAYKTKINPTEEQNKLKQLNINLLIPKDPRFFTALKEIHDPPQLLYYRGQLPEPDSLMVAVVGTRMITGYGRVTTPIITKSLAGGGAVVVSGLAYGVDAEAHKAAIEAKGVTLAVLGCGIDDATIYPKDHLLLATQILENQGCIISEYPPKTPGLKQNFIMRDRIMSGLCQAIVVVECDLKSGSLITAKFAVEQNRLLFAVPGNITSKMSEGPNRLIQQGARPILEGREVFGELNITPTASNSAEIFQIPKLNTQETIIFGFLSNTPKYPDQLVAESGLSASQVTATLGMLELKGVIKNLGGNQYVRNV